MEDGFSATIRKDIGPINLQFQIPMFCASKLQVRYLQIMKVRHCPQPHVKSHAQLAQPPMMRSLLHAVHALCTPCGRSCFVACCVQTDPKYNPYRWVRYVTTSNSYVMRS